MGIDQEADFAEALELGGEAIEQYVRIWGPIDPWGEQLPAWGSSARGRGFVGGIGPIYLPTREAQSRTRILPRAPQCFTWADYWWQRKHKCCHCQAAHCCPATPEIVIRCDEH